MVSSQIYQLPDQEVYPCSEWVGYRAFQIIRLLISSIQSGCCMFEVSFQVVMLFAAQLQCSQNSFQVLA